MFNDVVCVCFFLSFFIGSKCDNLVVLIFLINGVGVK